MDRVRLWLAFAYIGIALITLGAIWVALPARWAPVDVSGSVLCALLLLAAGGLLARQPWGDLIAVVIAWCALISGLCVCTLLIWTAVYLRGLYGPVGAGGSLILCTVALLVFPYWVVFPVLHLQRVRTLLKPVSRSAHG